MDLTIIISPYVVFFVIPFFVLIFKILIKVLPRTTKRPPIPPGPKPWPIVGNLLQMGQKPHITMTQFAKHHGPLISLRLGTQLLIVGSSPSAATEILKTHDRLLSTRYMPKMMNIDGIYPSHVSLMFAPVCNQRWRSLRSLCQAQLFSAQSIESRLLLMQTKMIET